MTQLISLDLLLRIQTNTSVTFWRPLGWGEMASSQQFNTGRDWVQVPGGTLALTLGSQRPATDLDLRLTAFVPAGAPGGTVTKVETGDSPPVPWTPSSQAPPPPSSSFVSPTYDVTSAPIELQCVASVGRTKHDLKLTIDTTTYTSGGTPPSPPIVIADLSHVLPQPSDP